MRYEILYDKPFTKDNLDLYLKELAKEFRKQNGKNMSAEIILIGGASVVINYGFREMTYDMDAIISAASSMKDAINVIGNKYNLPYGWLNTDFMNTESYTPRIIQYSKYYRTYSNVISYRTITGEYLVAMKLMAGRLYKYDLSDVVGILMEQEKSGNPLDLDMIKKAIVDLYDSYDNIPDNSKAFIEKIIEKGNYEEIYNNIRQEEIDNKEILLDFQEEYPESINKDNVNEIISNIRKRQNK